MTIVCDVSPFRINGNGTSQLFQDLIRKAYYVRLSFIKFKFWNWLDYHSYYHFEIWISFPQMAQQIGARFCEVSALESTNVFEAFQFFSRDVYREYVSCVTWLNSFLKIKLLNSQDCRHLRHCISIISICILYYLIRDSVIMMVILDFETQLRYFEAL